MAGHSKFANIRHRKAAQDAKRGKLFTKLIREVVIAARMGGEEVSSNPRLREAVEKALKGNVTRDAVNRAMARGAGSIDGKDLEEVLYEGYGPGGTAVMVRCLTDNRNRTVSVVRHAFNKYGGNLAVNGSVAYLFKPSGILYFSADTEAEQETLFEAAITAGAEDVTLSEKEMVVTTSLKDFSHIKETLIQQSFKPIESEVTQVASNQVVLDQADSEKLLKLLDCLDDLDDVQAVYSNADISDQFCDG